MLYCTGLGLTDAGGNALNTPSLSIGGLRAELSYAGVASPKAYPPAGAPSLLGGLASSSLASRLAACLTVVGRCWLNAYMVISYIAARA